MADQRHRVLDFDQGKECTGITAMFSTSSVIGSLKFDIIGTLGRQK